MVRFGTARYGTVRYSSVRVGLRLRWFALVGGICNHRCCCGYKCGSECCSVHTWNDNLRDSLPHLNAVVTPENLQCVRGLSVQKTAERILHN